MHFSRDNLVICSIIVTQLWVSSLLLQDADEFIWKVLQEATLLTLWQVQFQHILQLQKPQAELCPACDWSVAQNWYWFTWGGPLHKRKAGNKYIITPSDYFSNWPKVVVVMCWSCCQPSVWHIPKLFSQKFMNVHLIAIKSGRPQSSPTSSSCTVIIQGIKITYLNWHLTSLRWDNILLNGFRRRKCSHSNRSGQLACIWLVWCEASARWMGWTVA